jgi:hypothetical protein
MISITRAFVSAGVPPQGSLFNYSSAAATTASRGATKAAKAKVGVSRWELLGHRDFWCTLLSGLFGRERLGFSGPGAGRLDD